MKEKLKNFDIGNKIENCHMLRKITTEKEIWQ